MAYGIRALSRALGASFLVSGDARAALDIKALTYTDRFRFANDCSPKSLFTRQFSTNQPT
jgi:hypothetical protein